MTLSPRSLSGRLLVVAFVLIVVALSTTGIAMDVALSRFIQGQVDGRLDGQIASVRDALRAAPDGSLFLERTVDGPPFERPASGWYWKVSAPETVLRSRSLLGEDFTFAPPLDEDRPKPVTVDGIGPPNEPLRVRAQRFRLGSRIVTIASCAPLHALEGPLHEAMMPLVVTLLLLSLVLVGGVLVQVRLGLRPLRLLVAELQRIRAGETDRIPQAQPSEVAPLVTELNLLLDQNAANLERARRHVANLAHGLKTPLATLALAFDEAGGEFDARFRPLVTTMDRRIRHHLSRARLAALGGPERTRTLLAARVADHLDVFRKLYADKALTYSAEIAPEIAVACESQDLDELLGNLIDNACKWARHRVLATAATTGTTIVLTIEDDGPGLSDQQTHDVMQPGRRIDESAPGYGFGLPITRELTELYGGTLSLGRSRLGGLKAEASLPAAEARVR